MSLRAMLLKFFCPIEEKSRREFRKEVHRMLATSEDMSRTVTLYRKDKREAIRQQ